MAHSDRLNIHWKFAVGTVGKEHKPITEDHTFHIAGNGKIITSALIGKLYEERNSYSIEPAKRSIKILFCKKMELGITRQSS